MGGNCSKATVELCGGRCPAACACWTCDAGHRCNCSCRYLIAIQFIVMLLAGLVAAVSLRERRKFLAIWSSVYMFASICMLLVTWNRGPDPHDIGFGCSSPFLIWATLLFIVSLTCYTSEFIVAADGANADLKYIFDPRRRAWVPKKTPMQTVGIH